MTRGSRDDGGAYLVLYALLLVGVFALIAVVLDVAALRQGRRGDRVAADLAATAGASLVDAAVPATAATACEAAWDYVRLNVDDDGGAVTAPPCAATFSSAICDATTALSATGTRGPVTVVLTHPVPNGHPLMRAEVAGGDIAQAIDPARDGSACERFGVEIRRTTRFLFGGFVGDDEGSTNVHAVARRAPASTTEAPGLVALEASGCDALTTTSTGVTLTVAGGGGAPVPPGIIAVDSTGASCGGFVIDPQSPGQITAEGSGASPGEFLSHASGTGNIARAYDPADVSALRLSPTPSPAAAPQGRAFVDERYGPAIASVRSSLGGAGAPLGFVTYEDPLFPCTVPGPPALPVIVPLGNAYVNCSPLRILGGAQVTFTGGTIVFAGGIDVEGGGCLAVNHGGCGVPVAASTENVVYLRAGDLQKAPTGNLHLFRTAVHLSGSAASSDGTMVVPANTTASPTTLTWTPPASGPLEDLALWAESGQESALGGQPSMVTNGLFFTPNARLTLASRSGGTTLRGQFVARRVAADGTTPLRVETDPSVAVTTRAASVRLLR